MNHIYWRIRHVRTEVNAVWRTNLGNNMEKQAEEESCKGTRKYCKDVGKLIGF